MIDRHERESGIEWLAAKLGYKGGIISGLLLVAVGGFWFIPATHIGSFWAFLLGVCIIAAGLTFLETIANPYATVLGPEEYGATRINLAQSCNGIGLIFGPIAGGMFFYSKNAAGESTGSENLWILLCRRRDRGRHTGRHILFCQCSRHQSQG